MLNSQFSSDENWELIRLTVQTRREASRLNKRTMKHAELTDDLQERASLYAAGAMPENERREYAQHLEEERCPVCTKEVDELQSLMSLFAFSTPLQSPSPAIRERLLDQARASAPGRAAVMAHRRSWFGRVAALGAVAATALLVLTVNQNLQLRRLSDSLRTRITELESQLSEQRVLLASLTSADVRIINLAGQGTTPAANGRIFWDQPARRWRVYVHNLPPVPADRSYQLWFVPRTGNPISASVFNTETDGSAMVDIPGPDNVVMLAAAAVTTEPAGGLPQPSGPFALLGMVN